MSDTATAAAAPELSEQAGVASASVEHASVLAEALANVALFAAKDKFAPVIHGVRVTLADGVVKLEATNRYALGEASVPAESSNGTADVIVPADDVKRVIATLKAAKAAPASITVVGETFTVEALGTSVSCRADDGDRFPQTAGLWPDASREAECPEAFGIGEEVLPLLGKMKGGRGVKLAHLSALKPITWELVGADVPTRGLLMPYKVA